MRDEELRALAQAQRASPTWRGLESLARELARSGEPRLLRLVRSAERLDARRSLIERAARLASRLPAPRRERAARVHRDLIQAREVEWRRAVRLAGGLLDLPALLPPERGNGGPTTVARQAHAAAIEWRARKLADQAHRRPRGAWGRVRIELDQHDRNRLAGRNEGFVRGFLRGLIDGALADATRRGIPLRIEGILGTDFEEHRECFAVRELDVDVRARCLTGIAYATVDDPSPRGRALAAARDAILAAPHRFGLRTIREPAPSGDPLEGRRRILGVSLFPREPLSAAFERAGDAVRRFGAAIPPEMRAFFDDELPLEPGAGGDSSDHAVDALAYSLRAREARVPNSLPPASTIAGALTRDDLERLSRTLGRWAVCPHPRWVPAEVGVERCSECETRRVALPALPAPGACENCGRPTTGGTRGCSPDCTTAIVRRERGDCLRCGHPDHAGLCRHPIVLDLEPSTCPCLPPSPFRLESDDRPK